MLFRMQKLDGLQLYQHYNIGHPGWPYNLPPPLNPEKLRSFVIWCLSETVRQQNEENDPDAAKARRKAR